MVGSTPSERPSSWAGRAPAKVNVALRVLAREAGGHHQIETIFQALELADEVELALRSDGQVVLELEGVPEGELGPDDENLAVRAARAFLRAVREEDPGGTRPGVRGREGEEARPGSGMVGAGASGPGVDIRLVKRIPHGAGLGGGSSDAAAVLRGMNEAAGAPLERDRLLALGGELGADVPFFLSGAVRALAWGRGDRLLPLPPLPPRDIVLAVPSEPVATAWAYGVLAEHREKEGAGAAPAALLDEVLRGGGTESREGAGSGPAGDAPDVASGGWKGEAAWERAARLAVNDFEEALFPHRPELAKLKAELLRLGARPALLAGSGSAVFGVFPESSLAEEAAVALEAVLPSVRVIRTRTLG